MGAAAGARARAVQVLAPEQEFDGVITGRDIGFDFTCLVKGLAQEIRRDAGGIDVLAVDLDLRVGDDIGHIECVAIALGAVASIDVIDQAFIERPGIHLAFPIVNDRVAEAIDLCLLIGHAGGDPRCACCLERFVAGLGNQCVDGGIECLGSRKRILEFGFGHCAVVGQHLLGRRCSDSRTSEDGSRCYKQRDRRADDGFPDHGVSLRRRWAPRIERTACLRAKRNWCQTVEY